MPLNIEATETTEPAEVAALKKKVEAVAKRYAKRHNWCSVVDVALEEMGVHDKPVRMQVEVEYVVPIKARLEIDPTQFAGKTEEEQHALMASLLRGSTSTYFREDTRQITTPEFGEVTVSSLNEYVIPPMVIGDYTVPEGILARYTSREGRVAHLLRPNAGHNTRYAAALCGTSSYHWTENSARSENRVCANCQKQAEPAPTPPPNFPLAA
jgi:hypothetical protein